MRADFEIFFLSLDGLTCLRESGLFTLSERFPTFRVLIACVKLSLVRTIAFTKMHGLGNDFIVINAVSQPFILTAVHIRRMADRRLGIGCDQLLVLEPPRDALSDFFYRIFNADGGEVEQCGNGARCVALLIKEKGLSLKKEWVLKTSQVSMRCRVVSDEEVSVELPAPIFEAAAIPYQPDQPARFHENFTVVNVGNPHAVVVVEAVESVDLNAWGQLIGSDPRFPEGVNLSVMAIDSDRHIHLRVFERGVGETQACGSAAMAAVAAGRRSGLLASLVRVSQPGGVLKIGWQGIDSNMKMLGPAHRVCEGEYFLL